MTLPEAPRPPDHPSGRAGRWRPVSARGLALALLAALCLAWPMLLFGGPVGYFDTASYLSNGAEIARRLGVAAGGEATAIVGQRAAIYSLYLHGLSQTPLGFLLPLVLQTALVLLLAAALVAPPVRITRPAVLVAAGLAGVTTLPWFAVYLMPDILAAAVILYAALLAGRIDGLGPGERAAVCLVGCFATASHFGHVPLAAGAFAVALVLRAVRRDLTRASVALAVLPIAVAVALNAAGAGLAGGSGPSGEGGGQADGQRLPLLLARSIEDGPARWYLDETCGAERYAICEVFDTMPNNIHSFLWDEDGIKTATPEQMERILAEETLILRRALAAYPVEQGAAFLRNVARQATKVGTEQMYPVRRGEAGDILIVTDDPRANAILARFNDVTIGGTALGIVALLVLLTLRPPGRAGWEIVIVILLGVAGNALIFGGLSAPVDRYQSRVIWLLPALVAILAVSHRRPPRADRHG